MVTALAPGQRYTDNRDLNVKLPVLCARRENSAAVDEFVAIHETYQGRPFIRDIERLVTPEGIVAVRVDRGEEVDYLISRSWEAEPGAFGATTLAGELVFDASFAALTTANGEVTRAVMIGEGHVSLGKFSLSAAPGPRGHLVAFDDDEDFLLIEPETDWPEGDALAGRWGFIRHDHGCSTFTVRDVRKVEGGRLRINLKYTPHLALNHVMATGVEGDSTLVEPRPCHPWRTSTSQPNLLGYQVYRQLEGGLELVGEMRSQGTVRARDNWGKTLGPALPTIRVEGNLGNLEPGDELAITRLRPDKDVVEITPWISFEPGG